MRALKYIISILFISICSSVGFAQALRVWQPDVFEEVNTLLINPSRLESNQGVFIGNQSFFGSFSDIRSFYGLASIAIGQEKNTGLGLLARARQEGELIGEYRLKMNYWRSVSINKEWTLVAGIQLGAVNTFLKPTRSTAGGAAWAPDLDIGLTIRSVKNELSIGSSQMTNSTVQPLSQKITFQRYYSLATKSVLFSHSDFEFSMLAFVQLINGLQDVFRFKAIISWRELLNLGVGLGNDGARFTLMLPEIRLAESRGFMFGVGYQIPVNKFVAPSFQPFQIHLGYKILN